MAARAVDALIKDGWNAGQPGYDPAGLSIPPKGTRDPHLIQWAARNDFCFVTKDRGFAKPGAAPSRHAGIAILVCSAEEEVEVIGRLSNAAKHPDRDMRGLRFLMSRAELAFLDDDGNVSTLDGRPFIADI